MLDCDRTEAVSHHNCDFADRHFVGFDTRVSMKSEIQIAEPTSHEMSTTARFLWSQAVPPPSSQLITRNASYGRRPSSRDFREADRPAGWRLAGWYAAGGLPLGWQRRTLRIPLARMTLPLAARMPSLRNLLVEPSWTAVKRGNNVDALVAFLAKVQLAALQLFCSQERP